ncbi:MAG TPA: YhcH/YjgK/YiaL family protein, partial [Desulfobacterales bacterium]|nr:YhcH/YjgK/YiaL family protein [Desulfobacterales bacterium]
ISSLPDDDTHPAERRGEHYVMIIDRISNAHLYEHLSPRIKRAFDYLRRTDLASLSPGRHDIDGDRLYVMLSQYETKPKPQGNWEAHRRYIDLQVVLQGTEQIGYSHVSRLTPGAYAADRDFVPLAGDGDFLTIAAGEFMLLFPEDGHMPGIAVGAPHPVTKAVFKIEIE